MIQQHTRVGAQDQLLCGNCRKSIPDCTSHVTVTIQRESRVDKIVNIHQSVLTMVFCNLCSKARGYQAADTNQLLNILAQHDYPFMITGASVEQKTEAVGPHGVQTQ